MTYLAEKQQVEQSLKEDIKMAFDMGVAMGIAHYYVMPSALPHNVRPAFLDGYRVGCDIRARDERREAQDQFLDNLLKVR